MGPLPLLPFAYLKVSAERTTMLFALSLLTLSGALRYAYVFHWRRMQVTEGNVPT